MLKTLGTPAASFLASQHFQEATNTQFGEYRESNTVLCRERGLLGWCCPTPHVEVMQASVGRGQ